MTSRRNAEKSWENRAREREIYGKRKDTKENAKAIEGEQEGNLSRNKTAEEGGTLSHWEEKRFRFSKKGRKSRAEKVNSHRNEKMQIRYEMTQSEENLIKGKRHEEGEDYKLVSEKKRK